ncbi:MAG: dephospho-CoA kinase [Deltaproteobacteria bacterium]|nr:dephospho-CoA kinase [Deltaproteobacteria bacterium]
MVVFADDETCLKRLMNRDGLDRDTAVKELQSQWPLTEKAMRADHVIDNSGRIMDSTFQVERLVELLQG